MIRLARAWPLAILLAAPALVRSEAPRLTGTAPLGVRRGHATDVTFEGSGLAGNPRLIAPFAVRVEPSDEGTPDGGGWSARLTVAPETAVGVYPIRVLTDAGLSNPLLFAVGQVRQVAEAEPNDSAGEAQRVEAPVVIEGECSGNDVDTFRFAGRKGERIVVDALCARIGSGLDPAIRLTTADHRFVASEDDAPGLFTDARLFAELPEDGEYLLRIHDAGFEGKDRPRYRMLVGAVPAAAEVHPIALPRGQNVAAELRGGTLTGDHLVALRTPCDPSLAVFFPRIPARLLGDGAWSDSELDVELPLPVPLAGPMVVVEPSGAAGALPPLTPPLTFVGRIAEPGERDELTIAGAPGGRVEVRVEAFRLGSALDGRLRALAPDGAVLGEADDGKPGGRRRGQPAAGGDAGSTDPALDVEFPEGTDRVRLEVGDLLGRGGVGFGYRMDVEPAGPAFRLGFEDHQISIPRGGVALLPVTVRRSGYDGPIALDLADLPAEGGVVALPGVVPAGQSVGVVGLRAEAGATAFGARELRVVGSGDGCGPVTASGTIVFAEQRATGAGFGQSGTLPSHVRPTLAVAVAVVDPGPLRIEPTASEVVVPRGTTVELGVRIFREGDGAGEGPAGVTLGPLPLPEGLSAPEVGIEAGSTEATVAVSAGADAPLGRASIGLVARAAAREGGRGRGRGSQAPQAPTAPIAGAMLTVEVVRPARLELDGAAAELRPGSTGEVRGRVVRVPPFSGAVEVRLEGLPDGVRAEPVSVAPEASEFTITLEVDPGAAAADARPIARLSPTPGGSDDDAGPAASVRLVVLPAE